MRKASRRVVNRRLLFLLAFAVLAAAILEYRIARVSKGVAFVMKMGSGWNIANTLDAHGLGKDAGTPEAYETYWGRPSVTPEMIAAIANAGFDTLRIPVTWYEYMDDQNQIDRARMDRVQYIVDLALDAGLYVIVNAHHDAWYEPNPAHIDQAEAALRDVWGQIARRFADYGERLLFEGMNEPRLIGDPQEWTAGTPAARDCVNRLNAAFVEIVRDSGGANATRYLLLPTYCASVRDEALQALTLPDDDRLIVSVHLYEPYAFALQESGTAHWDPDRDADTKPIREAIANLQKRFIDRGIPVLITEYGAMDKHNEAARIAWANYVKRLAGAANIRCIWWDTSLLEADTLTWRSPSLLRALTQTSESSKESP